ncbi:hypothetical protein BIV24_29635 [Streptomyces colonosanans]|uniref:Uncharacterized protein n=1 Tax=Streptomyces colonosanans TaxID=1428652 RepID=A0A1S2NTX5_9ACTN|nr:hypothetical protein BIV24_29635 [Streptomyces colonosanans]
MPFGPGTEGGSDAVENVGAKAMASSGLSATALASCEAARGADATTSLSVSSEERLPGTAVYWLPSSIDRRTRARPVSSWIARILGPSCCSSSLPGWASPAVTAACRAAKSSPSLRRWSICVGRSIWRMAMEGIR